MRTLSRVLDAANDAIATGHPYQPRPAHSAAVRPGTPASVPGPVTFWRHDTGDGPARSRDGGLDDTARYVAVVVGTDGDQPDDHRRAAQTVRALLPAVVRAGLVMSVHPQVSQVPAAREHLRLLLGRTGTPQFVVIAGPIAAGRHALGLPPVSPLHLRETSVIPAPVAVHAGMTSDR
ncbi:hypothetical protein AB0B66_33295 [Catellatospora sp. NPDC049111]|uniref:hypothetical protein n=1 Tax=Catellatospora sp. NPDC049111 TaxID=3155271 RepID=UPI0033DFFA2E